MPIQNISITAKAVSFSLATGKPIFSNISTALTHQTYGLVGDNGVGKSTFAKVLAGKISYSGEVLRSGEVVYLAQSEERPEHTTGDQFLTSLWVSLFADPAIWGPLLEGVPLDLPLSQLSGGEWTRLRIAKCLSIPSHMLILDEPTNSLDQQSREIIYRFIANYDSGGLLVISHDRQLLEHVHHILEMSNQGLSVYGGNYSFYNQEKSAEKNRQEHSLNLARRQKEKIIRESYDKQQLQEKRSRQGQKHNDKGGTPKLLAGRNKRRAQNTLGKIKGQEQKRITSAQEEFQNIWDNLKAETSIQLFLPDLKIPNSKKIFEINKGNILFSNSKASLWTDPISFILTGPEKLAIQGPNGSGKSSLIKALTGVTPKDALLGGWNLGDLNYAVLDQEYQILKPELSVLDNIQETSKLPVSELRNQLAHFQFAAEKVHQKIETLSGGEKLKASLAKILLIRPLPELIILDEPTNNLDINSIKVLEESFSQYKGAMIIVSHDQEFLKNIGVTRVLKIGAPEH